MKTVLCPPAPPLSSNWRPKPAPEGSPAMRALHTFLATFFAAPAELPRRMVRATSTTLAGSLMCALLLYAFSAPVSASAAPAFAQSAQAERLLRIPPALREWIPWANWGADNAPAFYQDPKKKVKVWPGQLWLAVEPDGARFTFAVEAFAQAWVPLPGGRDAWPRGVRVNGVETPVVEHAGRPALQLASGAHWIEGHWRWSAPPRSLSLPPEIGLLSLSVRGRPVEAATWDAEGRLWLNQERPQGAESKDFAEWKVYRVLEDGVPMWLRMEVEITVSGKSRELELGGVLPEGWELTLVDGPLPAQADAQGRLKVQARAGKWTLRADAVRLHNEPVVGFAQGVRPAAAIELVALQTNPALRLIELSGVSPVDVSQTTFPARWRGLPVFQWSTAAPFRIEERMRGMGRQESGSLTIVRELWLDEQQGGLAFRDTVSGKKQRLWRLDIAGDQQLGAVRSGEEGQLITRNPLTGASGVELRTQNFNLDAAGRGDSRSTIPASGWNATADSVRATLHLPPGWRLLALFGADQVKGDWLTTWTLLDLFVVLVFSMGAYRLWGAGAGTLACAALVLSYQEPDAPQFVWLFVLISAAMLRLFEGTRGAWLLRWVRGAAVLTLVLVLVPFLAQQLQQAIYPQLEPHGREALFQGYADASKSIEPAPEPASDAGAMRRDRDAEQSPLGGVLSSAPSSLARKAVSVKEEASGAFLQKAKSGNLAFDPAARVQTGPPVPEWTWREITYSWNGPVAAGQQVRAVWLPRGLGRLLTLVRVGLLCALAALLLDARRWLGLWRRPTATAALLLTLAGILEPREAAAQFPDATLLETLRTRLAETSDAYPNAADIPAASLTLENRRVLIDAEIHAAVRTAVPLPGRLSQWSPLSVLVDELPVAVLRREDGFLWAVLEEGVHRVRIEGMLNEVSDWEWGFHLRPRRVAVRAEGWQVTGIGSEGVPEQQVMLSQKQKTSPLSGYEHQEYKVAVGVERRLELGLVWRARSVARRLSAGEHAVSLRIPLLPGERVLTPNLVVADGMLEVRLGARQKEVGWESELPAADALKLETRAGDGWVETWRLQVSPVWNVAFEGLPPIFEAQSEGLEPVWHPWPGETVRLAVSRPEAIPGPTVTVGSVKLRSQLGLRQRTSRLEFNVRSSLGEEFAIDLPAGATVTSLQTDGREVPARMEGQRLQVTLHPGQQPVVVAWRTNIDLKALEHIEPVRLATESANVELQLDLPKNRWVLWAFGPVRGPAVRFWGLLACSILCGFALGKMRRSPLGVMEWMLLAMGLTQVPLPFALVVVGWLFALSWRGTQKLPDTHPILFNLLQLGLLGLSVVALAVLVDAVAQGLLGEPKMFVVGNGSSSSALRWFQAQSHSALPSPGCVSVSIWWFRLCMLLWALWLASALLRWLKWGWEQFSFEGCFRRKPSRLENPPPPPAA